MTVSVSRPATVRCINAARDWELAITTLYDVLNICYKSHPIRI